MFTWLFQHDMEYDRSKETILAIFWNISTNETIYNRCDRVYNRMRSISFLINVT